MKSCKHCKRIAYQLKAHKYYTSLLSHEKLHISNSIVEYSLLNGVIIVPKYNELDFQNFIANNEGDDTLIQAVTGFTN